MNSKQPNRHSAQARLVVTIIALLAAAPLHAAKEGVCLVCPAGFDCSSGKPVISGSDGQILVREGTGTSWKSLASTSIPTTLGSTATAGNTSTTTYSKSDHAHGYDSGKLYGVMPYCANQCANSSNGLATSDCQNSSHSNGKWPSIDSNDANNKYCWCFKYKLDSNGGRSRPVFFQALSSAANCRTDCSQYCADYSVWRSAATW